MPIGQLSGTLFYNDKLPWGEPFGVFLPVILAAYNFNHFLILIGNANKFFAVFFELGNNKARTEPSVLYGEILYYAVLILRNAAVNLAPVKNVQKFTADELFGVILQKHSVFFG